MQTFTVVVGGNYHVIDLSPFGETGAQMGTLARLELCASTMNSVVALLSQSRYEHMLLKNRLLAGYQGKDSDAARKRFLDANPEYIESRRSRDFLKDAHGIMLYGHYPRLRDAEQNARQMELASVQASRYRTQ